jgi:hydroxymethylbilane synthase
MKVVTFRGTVQTRLKKLDAGDVDGTMLAAAGLMRLGMEEHITEILDPDDFVPAVGQGAIGITCLIDDANANRRLAALNHDVTFVRVAAERAFLAVLDGSCRTPIAAHAKTDGQNRLQFQGLVAKPDGSVVHRVKRTGSATLKDAESMGRDAGLELKDRIGPDFLVATAHEHSPTTAPLKNQ